MVTPVNGGDLVEELIFNAFKDKSLRSGEAFYQLIKKDYGYIATSNLYRRIVNYQIKKYGISLYNLNQREYQKYFSQREPTKRKQKNCRDYISFREKRRIEKIEKNKYKELIKGKNTKTNIN